MSWQYSVFGVNCLTKHYSSAYCQYCTYQIVIWKIFLCLVTHEKYFYYVHDHVEYKTVYTVSLSNRKREREKSILDSV